jgi:hypothetical protein
MDIGDSTQRSFDKFFDFLPNLLGCLVLLLVGFIVAKVLQGVVRTFLKKLDINQRLASSDASRYVDNVLPGSSASSWIARIVFWLVFVFFIFAAIGALGVSALTEFMNEVLAYLPNVIAAIIIFVVAALVAGAVAVGVRRFMGDSPTGKIVSTAVPALVMVIALFMILNQLKIAEDIVTIAFAATMGALGLGLALAFGLGGRSNAERMLEDAYRSGREARDQVRQDLDREASRPASDGTASGQAVEPTASNYGVGASTPPTSSASWNDPTISADLPSTAPKTSLHDN